MTDNDYTEVEGKKNLHGVKNKAFVALQIAQFPLNYIELPGTFQDIKFRLYHSVLKTVSSRGWQQDYLLH